jgi:Ankyrin repeats (many copies)/Ankyrin repeats (3 copies)
MDEKQTWRIIRKELEDIGITVVAFDANRDFVMDWFKECIATGAFEEKTLEDALSSQSCEYDLGQFREDPYNPTTNQPTTEPFDLLTLRDMATRGPVVLETQYTQTVTTQEAMPTLAFLPAKELNTTLQMQVSQRAPEEARTQRERVPRVAALIAWVLRYDTGLINAAREGHEAVVRQLLEKGANIDAKTNRRETALHKAAGNGHEAVVRLLLEKGANVDVEDSLRWTALHMAAGNGHEAVVRLLLENGVNIDEKTYNGETALHIAAKNRHKAVVRLLRTFTYSHE